MKIENTHMTGGPVVVHQHTVWATLFDHLGIAEVDKTFLDFDPKHDGDFANGIYRALIDLWWLR